MVRVAALVAALATVSVSAAPVPIEVVGCPVCSISPEPTCITNVCDFDEVTCEQVPYEYVAAGETCLRGDANTECVAVDDSGTTECRITCPSGEEAASTCFGECGDKSLDCLPIGELGVGMCCPKPVEPCGDNEIQYPDGTCVNFCDAVACDPAPNSCYANPCQCNRETGTFEEVVPIAAGESCFWPSSPFMKCDANQNCQPDCSTVRCVQPNTNWDDDGDGVFDRCYGEVAYDGCCPDEIACPAQCPNGDVATSVCGGIAGFTCKDGLDCIMDDSFPDAMGVCCSQEVCADSNAEYKACGTPCPDTCGSLNEPTICIEVCQEGCACKEGFALSSDAEDATCVPVITKKDGSRVCDGGDDFSYSQGPCKNNKWLFVEGECCKNNGNINPRRANKCCSGQTFENNNGKTRCVRLQ